MNCNLIFVWQLIKFIQRNNVHVGHTSCNYWIISIIAPTEE
jgi:hypothetical protein